VSVLCVCVAGKYIKRFVVYDTSEGDEHGRFNAQLMSMGDLMLG